MRRTSPNTTRRGKFLEWHRILDNLHLRADESVLDIGCGRGAVANSGSTTLRVGTPSNFRTAPAGFRTEMLVTVR